MRPPFFQNWAISTCPGTTSNPGVQRFLPWWWDMNSPATAAGSPAEAAGAGLAGCWGSLASEHDRSYKTHLLQKKEGLDLHLNTAMPWRPKIENKAFSYLTSTLTFPVCLQPLKVLSFTFRFLPLRVILIPLCPLAIHKSFCQCPYFPGHAQAPMWLLGLFHSMKGWYLESTILSQAVEAVEVCAWLSVFLLCWSPKQADAAHSAHPR